MTASFGAAGPLEVAARPRVGHPGPVVDLSAPPARRVPLRFTVYRTVAIGEGLAFPALLVAAVLQPWFADAPAIAVLGSVHGMLFCLYLPMVLLVRRPLGWNRLTTVLALVSSLLPGGTWWVERHWGRRERLRRLAPASGRPPFGAAREHLSRYRGD